MKPKFDLGDLIADKITGFKGIVTGVCFYNTGCIQYGVQPLELKDGKPNESHWHDEIRVKLIEKRKHDFGFSIIGNAITSTSEKDMTGGPMNVPCGTHD